tara:strand:- start:1863 stop:2447 length:585 start_codon:yes stop_codon:yes gene_type:complete
MYKRDQYEIQKLCESDPKYTREAILFVSRSIRNHFWRLNKITDEEKSLGIQAPSLKQKIKRDAFEYIHSNYKQLHKDIFNPNLSLAEKILSVSSIPGIGIVKAGFVLQLCIGKVGCLDVHNLKMFGFSESAFKFSKTTTKNTALAKSRLYIETCEKLGGSEFLWDNWCEFIAAKYPKHFTSADQVSQMHVNLIV